jgi:hypothetical protein
MLLKPILSADVKNNDRTAADGSQCRIFGAFPEMERGRWWQALCANENQKLRVEPTVVVPPETLSFMHVVEVCL